MRPTIKVNGTRYIVEPFGKEFRVYIGGANYITGSTDKELREKLKKHLNAGRFAEITLRVNKLSELRQKVDDLDIAICCEYKDEELENFELALMKYSEKLQKEMHDLQTEQLKIR